MAYTIRPIVIDDTDAAIKYTGQGWFEDVGDLGAGNGTPYLQTSHGTTGNDSFSFSFTGQSFSVCCRSGPPRPISVQEHTSLSWARYIGGASPLSMVQATGRRGIQNGNVS